MEGDSLHFEINQPDPDKNWMLQKSTDGETWIDMRPFRDDFFSSYLRTTRRDLGVEETDQVLFRAREFVRHEEVSREYGEALARWNKAALERYTFVVRWSSWIQLTEVRYTVSNGEVTEVEVLQRSPEDLIIPPSEVTVDDLFARVASAIEQNAASIDAGWDPVLGFPSRVYIDFSVMIADEEQSWSMIELTPLD